MSQTIERTWADARFAEGKAAGIVEGKAEGTAEGKTEALLRTLRLRWGTVPTDLAAITAEISSEERLDALQDAAIPCPDLEDFRSHLNR